MSGVSGDSSAAEVERRAADLEGRLRQLGAPVAELGFLGRRRFAKVAAEIESLAQAHGEVPVVLALRGRLARAQGDAAAALMHFTAALRRLPNDIPLLVDATCAALAAGDAAAADLHARAAATLREGDAALYANYALALLLNREGKRALGAITNACKIDPEGGDYRQILEYVRRILHGRDDYPSRIER